MADDFISDEDKALFQAHTRHVKPLNQKKTRTAPLRSQVPPEKQNRQTAPGPVSSKKYYLSDFIVEPVFSDTRLAWFHPSIASPQSRALKNGHISWESRLDLHGLNAEEAREALCQFIETQTNNYKRCVLIVHGKGGNLGEPPILKNLINRWLPQFEEVLAFHSALPADGGNGAVYVLLKRTR